MQNFYASHVVFDGVVLQNGACISNGSLRIRGNFGVSSSPVKSAALRLTGAQNVNGYDNVSGITSAMLDIGVECASGDATPQTIAFGSAANAIAYCYGALNFGAAGNTFAESNNDGNVFSFQGMASGDSTLPGEWATYKSGLPAGWSGEVSFRLLPTGRQQGHPRQCRRRGPGRGRVRAGLRDLERDGEPDLPVRRPVLRRLGPRLLVRPGQLHPQPRLRGRAITE